MIKRIMKNYGKSLLGFKFWSGVFCVFWLFQLDAELPMFFTEYHWNVERQTADFKIVLSRCIFYGMYTHMLSILSTIGFGVQFCDEWKSGVVPQLVKKMGIKKYSLLYTILAAMSGGGIAWGGFILYAWYMHIHIPLYNPAAAQPHMQEMFYAFTLSDKSGLQYVMIMSLLMFLTGALSAVMAICISTISENKYFVMVSPYLIYRIYVEACKLMKLPDYLRIDYYLFGRKDIGTSFLEFSIIITMVFIMSIGLGHWIFRKGVRRRLAYEKY